MKCQYKEYLFLTNHILKMSRTWLDVKADSIIQTKFYHSNILSFYDSTGNKIIIANKFPLNNLEQFLRRIKSPLTRL